MFRDAARELLERRGYTVVGEADSAASGVEAAERLAPDAVLLDVRLPDGSGFALSARLTLTPAGPAVLLMSADRGHPPAEVVRDCGACGFVLKSRLAATDFAAFWP